MQIEDVKIDAIIPYEFNNKVHDELQVERIANSIKEFGFTQPLVIDATNIVVIGHGRLLAAKKLGLTSVPCYRAEQLTPEQIKKLRILDNKLNESNRDIANLKLELDSLPDFNFGELQLATTDLFPEFEEPEFNPEEYEESEEWAKEKPLQVIVFVKDEGELALLKKDLDELWYTNYK